MVESSRFILFSMADYLLRHGDTLSSIVWPKSDPHKAKLRWQFVEDMKRDKTTMTDATA